MDAADTRSTGKVVIVTGASSGIGAASARRLAQRGHQVVLAARRDDRLTNVADEIRRAGGVATVRRVDVTDGADVGGLVDAVATEHGRVDVIVNNAG